MGFRTFAQLLRPELTALPRLPVGRLHSKEAAQAYGAALPWLDDLVCLWEVYRSTEGSQPPSRPPGRHSRSQAGSPTTCSPCCSATPSPPAVVLFYHRTKSRKEIDFVGGPLAGTAVEGKYIETGRWRGEAATVTASDWGGVLTTRNVLDCTNPDGAWAVPAGILATLIDT